MPQQASSANLPFGHPQPNLPALRGLAAQLGLEAVIAVWPENFIYATNVAPLNIAFRTRQGFAVLPAKGEPVVVCGTSEQRQMGRDGWIKDVRGYVEFENSPPDVLAEVLREKGLDKGVLGTDLDYLSANYFMQLQRQLPDVKFVDTSKDLAMLRAVKTRSELELLENTTKATHRAVLDAMAASKLGDTERMMADRIVDGIQGPGGADGMRHCVFVSGDRGLEWHGRAGPRVPAVGEIIRFDIGGKWGPWCSDMARTWSAGDPTPLQTEMYAKMREVHVATIEMIRPGMAIEEPFHFCKLKARELGVAENMTWIGHSLGLENHEAPMIRPGEQAKFEVGMAFNSEPAIIDENNDVYAFEDLFEITETGTRLLTLGYPQAEIPIIGKRVDS